MPQRPPRECMHPGCPFPAVPHSSMCDKHTRERQQRLDAARPPAPKRGYGNNWRKMRARVLSKHPWCADPYQAHTTPVPATDVDHIISKREGGTDDENNLQGLCHACHSRKTARSDRRWG